MTSSSPFSIKIFIFDVHNLGFPQGFYKSYQSNKMKFGLACWSQLIIVEEMTSGLDM